MPHSNSGFGRESPRLGPRLSRISARGDPGWRCGRDFRAQRLSGSRHAVVLAAGARPAGRRRNPQPETIMPQRKQTAVERSRDILDGRAGYRIYTDWGQVGVLEGGGHICELILNRVPRINPLWKPPWKTIDPDRYSPGRSRSYGPPPDGKLLAGIAGHSLSFDHFGPPSKEETAAGLATHGEAPCTRWKMKKVSAARLPTLHCGCSLHEAQIRFRRSISLDSTNPVVYCEERAENLGVYDRPISWNEHVTFGPPFLECGTTLFDMPATRAKTCPPGYSETIFLQ